MQTRLGKAQGKTTEQLTKESQKYLVEMRGLQELTGMTRDEQQKLRDAQMADARYSLHLSTMNKDEAANLQQYMVAYQAAFGAEAAAGLKDRIVNFGSITTEAGAASYQRGNKEYELAMRAQKEGMAFFQEGLVTTAKNTMASLGPLSTTFRLSEGQLKQMGFNAEMVNAALALTNTDQKEFDKRMKAIIATMVKQEDQTETNLKSEQQNRAKNLMYDALLAEAAKGLVSVFGLLNTVVTALAKMMANFIDFMSSKGIIPGLSPTNLSKFFEESASSSRPDKSGLSQPEQNVSKAAGESLAPSMAGRNSEDVLSKLNFGGKRAERTGGGEASPALLAMAEKIQDEYPDAIFTALNDRYHQDRRDKNSKSKHLVGKALDFSLGYDPTSEESDRIAKLLRMTGASYVKNEYKERSGGWTGGHFHVEVARQGGLFSGKDTGYPVMLHGKNESVWPEKELTTFMKDVQKTSLKKYKDELMDQISPSGTTTDIWSKLSDAFNTFSSKNKIKSNNLTNENFSGEVGKHGGLFSEKDAGYPVMLHGKNENVKFEKDLINVMKDVQKTSLEQYKQELMTQTVPGGITSDTGSKLTDAFNMFSNKLDSLISEQRNNNSIQAEILTYSRA
jgi:hypothetical protein